MKIKDLTGKRFGNQVAIKQAGRNKYGNVLWLCKCDCGNEHVVSSSKLIQGKSKSCGCYAKQVHTKMLEKHGITTGGKPRTFIIWNGMKARCYNTKAKSYNSYGGRGIIVCDEWLGNKGFENFHKWAISHGYSDELEIDRIDNEGNYCPQNCRFVSPHENRVRQRKTRFFNVNGIELSITAWCKKLKISKKTFHKKLEVSEDYLKEFLKEKLEEKEDAI